MAVKTESFAVKTKVNTDILDITANISQKVWDSGLAAGLGTRVAVALNKVTADEEEPPRAELAERGIPVAASISYDPAVFRACLKGRPLCGVQAGKDISALAKALGF